MSQPTTIAAIPVTQQERITLLDSLRGIAILGILMMNIPYFGLPSGVADDPFILNEYGTFNYQVWYVINLLPEGTMRALFSTLFGAGILLFMSRQEKRLPGIQPADFFIRRQLWLMLFSLIDAYILLWPGDILFDYAILGLVAFAFRKMSPKALIFAAGICLLLMLVRENAELYRNKKMIQKGELIAAIDTTKTKLTLKQKDELEGMQELKDKSTQKAKLEKAEKSKAAMLGSYGDVYTHNSNIYLHNMINYLYFGLWDVLIFMFLGMAFYKSGILMGTANTSIYWGLFLGGMGIGLLLSYVRLQSAVGSSFNQFDYTKKAVADYYELSRTSRSLGLFGLIMLLYKSGLFKWFFALMRPVGQMAFTHYLSQSIICGFVFWGIGLGWYGKLQRHEIYYVLAGIWVFQVIFSHIWLRYFLYGPFEWAWRSLTYWKKQPFIKE